MTRTVLCALDPSRSRADEKVLRTAARLAAAENAGLQVVGVVPELGVGQVTSFFPPDYQEKAVARAKENLQVRVRNALGEEAGKVSCIVRVGSIHREVLEAADAVGADLIVIGSHKPEVEDYLIGSSASHIVLHAPCSVYVVR